MSRPFDIINISGKKVIFLGELSKEYHYYLSEEAFRGLRTFLENRE